MLHIRSCFIESTHGNSLKQFQYEGDCVKFLKIEQ